MLSCLRGPITLWVFVIALCFFIVGLVTTYPYIDTGVPANGTVNSDMVFVPRAVAYDLHGFKNGVHTDLSPNVSSVTSSPTTNSMIHIYCGTTFVSVTSTITSYTMSTTTITPTPTSTHSGGAPSAINPYGGGGFVLWLGVTVLSLGFGGSFWFFGM